MTYVKVRSKAAVHEVAEVGRTTLSSPTGYVQAEPNAIRADIATTNFGLIRDLAR